MINYDELMSIYLTGLQWGFIATILLGATSWGFWFVVRFFKNISRA